MEEDLIMVLSILALVGLSLIIGIIMKYFSKEERGKKQSNEEYLMDTVGSGCGIIALIVGLGIPLVGILIWIFG